MRNSAHLVDMSNGTSCEWKNQVQINDPLNFLIVRYVVPEEQDFMPQKHFNCSLQSFAKISRSLLDDLQRITSTTVLVASCEARPFGCTLWNLQKQKI
jgi:hypothetical protein